MSKRRSDAQQTRKQLIEAGRKAFAKKGLKGTVLRDDVLRPAGVSTGSFYHQFENKTDLLLSILKDNANSYRPNVLEAMKPREGSTLEDIVRSAYTQTFDNADENGDIFQIASRERGSTDTRIALYLEDDRKLWQLGLAKSYEKLFPNSSPKKNLLTANIILHQGLGVVEDYLKLPKSERLIARKEILDALVKFSVGGIEYFLR